MKNFSMFLTLSFLVLGITTLSAAQSGRYVIAAPNMLRIGMEEEVSVTVFNVKNPVTVKLFLQDSPSRKKTFSQVQAEFKNYSPGTLKVKVDFSDLIDPKSKDKQYVYLVAVSNSPELTFHKEVRVLLSNNNNVVFVQTDKPIYTPSQTVYIRVVPMSVDLKPSDNKVNIEILNPQSVIVQRWKDLSTDKGFITERFKLPEFVLIGNWTVRALYGNQGLKNTSVTFEVREYVLPTFSVDIKGPSYILESMKTAGLSISSSYVYGKPVLGYVSLKLGIIGFRENIVFISSSPTRIRLSNQGIAHYTLELERIKDLEGGAVWFPDGARLYVEATVVEQASGVQESKIQSSIHFTKTPYTISLRRTAKYFRPNLPFIVNLDVHYPDKAIAKGVDVFISATDESKKPILWKQLKGANAEERKDTTNELGHAQFNLQIPGSVKKLYIQARVDHTKLKIAENENGLINFEVGMYSSPSQTYLVVKIPKGKVKVGGEKARAEVSLFSNNGLVGISKLHLMIVSRGRILETQVWERSQDSNAGNLITLTFHVTADMSPVARVVVYAVTPQGEIVSDSSTIEVEETFANKVKYIGDNRPLRPGAAYQITLEADPGSHVGILAVDKAVYLLRDEHRLTSKKAFTRLRSYDMGCGPGSGKNSKDVFEVAGLTVLAHDNFITTPRQDYSCSAISRRKRRSVDRVSECCMHGKAPSRSPGPVKCRIRAVEAFNTKNDKGDRIFSNECVLEMFECCVKEFGGVNLKGRSIDDMELGDIFGDDDFDITARTFFPETWLTEDYVVGKTGRLVIPVTVPDSITQWVLQAVGVSEQTGLGIAKPFYIDVFKQFFIKLTLPYSVQRGEQVSVIATAYNYMDEAVTVTLSQQGHPGICSMAKTDQKSDLAVRARIGPKNATSVSFNIVPIIFDVNSPRLPIEITGVTNFMVDRVRKQLLVEPEGVERQKTLSTLLDPKGMMAEKKKSDKEVKVDIPGDETNFKNNRIIQPDKQIEQITLDLPDNAIPNSAKGRFYLTGNFMGRAVSNVVTGNLDKLLRIPTGCGEQTMIYMSPNVYVHQYITNNKLIKATADQEKNAFKNIQSGYNRELTYRRRDGSYSAWGESRQGSTWLTAFVNKVFCQAQKLDGINIDQNIICAAVQYLVNSQDNDGAFVERKYVVHREMMGGVGDGKTAMTAFVLISILECQCDTVGTTQPMLKAVTFLKNNWRNIQSPFTLAITTYALALSGSPEKLAANDKLIGMAQFDQDTNTRYWNAGNKALNVEATAYALLAQVVLDRHTYSGPIVVWLTGQQSAKGGFISTQDTCVGLQALAAYSIEAGGELNMEITLTHGNDKNWKRILVVNKDNALLQQQVDITDALESWFIVETKGTGTAQMQVEARYNVPEIRGETCFFEVSAKAIEIKAAGLAEAGDAEGDKQEKKKKKRKRRNKKQKPDSISIKVCAKYLKVGKVSGMSIIEVGLWTGYEADLKSLQKLENNVSPGIQRYEISGRSVTLYMKEIPSAKRICLRFSVNKAFDAGNVQAAPVKVYDYYEPEDSCTIFYAPKKSSALVQGLCDKQGCRCTQDECAPCNPKISERSIDKQIRELCSDGDYDFAILGEMLFVDEQRSYLVYSIVANYIYFQKEKDKLKQEGIVSMWKEASCCTEFITKKDYLILGRYSKGGKKIVLDKFSFVKQVFGVDKTTGRIEHSKKDKKWFNKFVDEVMNVDFCPDNSVNVP